MTTTTKDLKAKDESKDESKTNRKDRDNNGEPMPVAQEEAQQQPSMFPEPAHLRGADVDPNEVLKHDPLYQMNDEARKDRENPTGPIITNADPRVNMAPDPLIGYKGDPKYNPSTAAMLRETVNKEED